MRKCLSSYKTRVISSKEQVIEQRIAELLADMRLPLGIRPMDNPRLWWRYAIGAVQALQRDRDHFEGGTD